MRTCAALLLVPLLLLACRQTAAQAGAPAKYEPEDGYHSYVRWNGLAREAVSTRYPGAALIDMHYLGCTCESPSSRQYLFKYWLRRHGREFGVYATVDAPLGAGAPRAAAAETADARIASFARWERHAAAAVRAKHPGAELVGRKPFGCRWLGAGAARQAFRFWIRQDDRNRLLRVEVDYALDTRRPIAARVESLREF
ncbi:Protein of unknown function [Paenibacillus sp. UNC496MF]|uniref:DUF3889 domain-containing protein n=1 Tax=Paenibacillus sp. UNC496MF TaxID=1502753 RepID=UPI0008E3B9A9|nr:DUF3889 domain-containing protein [Paenibacillus sp. UNC496MF]SFJ72922.1 Protein of unknown function [Paenibacillus sp. UNC496MF]